jgi:hypothetical protein
MAMIAFSNEYVAVGGRADMSDPQTKTLDLNQVQYLVPAWMFWSSLVGAVILSLGGSFLLHQDLKSDATDLDHSFKQVAQTLLMPLFQKMLVERVTLEPTSFGFEPMEEWDEAKLETGLNFVDVEKLAQSDAVLFKALSITYPNIPKSGNIALDCTEDSGTFSFGSKACNLVQGSYELSDPSEKILKDQLPVFFEHLDSDLVWPSPKD